MVCEGEAGTINSKATQKGVASPPLTTPFARHRLCSVLQLPTPPLPHCGIPPSRTLSPGPQTPDLTLPSPANSRCGPGSRRQLPTAPPPPLRARCVPQHVGGCAGPARRGRGEVWGLLIIGRQSTSQQVARECRTAAALMNLCKAVLELVGGEVESA